MRKTFYYTLLLIGIIYIFVSCTVPLSKQHLEQVNDTNKPEITILTPDDNSSYAATIVIRGVVTDQSNNTKGSISSLTYEVSGGGLIPQTSVPVASNGDFELIISTDNFSGTVSITLIAMDWNDNELKKTITLHDNGGFESLELTPGSEQVTLFWNDVPLSESYTLIYTENNTIPSELNGIKVENVTSPYTLSNLENGKCVSLIVKSHSSSGSDNWSPVKKAVPLSAFTLSPKITGYYDRLHISWKDLSLQESGFNYQILKSTQYGGPYENITSLVKNNYFDDFNVDQEGMYYYKITVNQENTLYSYVVSGQLSSIKPTKQRYEGTFNKPFASGGTGLWYFDATGDTVVAIDWLYGLHILDFSDGSSPQILVSYEDGFDSLYDLQIKGNYVYTIYEDNTGDETGDRVCILDIRPPYTETPNIIGETEILDYPTRVAVGNGYLFVEEQNEQVIKAYDISDITNPVYVDSYAINYNLFKKSHITAQGDYVYLFSIDPDLLTSRLEIVTINGENKFELVGALLDFNNPDGLEVSGDRAYITDHNGLHFVDVINPAVPDFIDSYTVFSQAPVVEDNFLYLPRSNEGVHIIDLSDPVEPDSVYDIQYDNEIMDLAVQGNSLYLSSPSGGIKKFAISDLPFNISEVSHYEDTGCFYKNVKVSGNYAHVLDYNNGYKVFDVSDPTSPQLIKELPYEGEVKTYDIQVYGDYSIIGAEGGALKILDLSDVYADPAADIRVLSETDCYPVNSFDINGEYLYIAKFFKGFQIIKTTDPENPDFIEGLSIGAGDIVVRNNYLYAVGDFFSPFVIYDITDPVNPEAVGSYGAFISIIAVEIFGDYAYLVDRNQGLFVLDISDPTNPTRIFDDYIEMPGVADEPIMRQTRFVCADSDFIFAADCRQGIYIINASDPTNLYKTNAISTGGDAMSLDISGKYLYVADGENGLKIYQMKY